MANRIAQHILYGAPQQFTIAHDLAGETAVHCDAAATNLGFNLAIANHLVHDVAGERDPRQPQHRDRMR